MMELIRFFAPLSEPIAMIWVLMVLGVLFLLRKKRMLAALFQLILAGLIYSIGATPLASRLVATLERAYARKDLGAIPACDAVVMLGGAHRPSQYDLFGVDLTPASDRIVTAVELMREHKGSALVIGGGGYQDHGQERAEGPLLEKWFKAWQLPVSPTFSLGVNADTHDEALHLQALAKERGWKRVILVTSAFHMKRAEATFRKAGVAVVPVACDYRSVGVTGWDQGFHLFPSHEGFEQMELYLHETMGWWVYSWRGWLGEGGANTGPAKPQATAALKTWFGGGAGTGVEVAL